MGEGAIALIDLSKQLDADESGWVKRAVIEQLAQAQREIKTSMNAGLAPEEFAVANRLSMALLSAEHVVENYWGRKHSAKSP